MTSRTSVLPLGFGLSAVLCFAPGASGDEPASAPRPPARVYTNDDLARVHPFRAETGVDSVPAAAVPEPAEGSGSRRSGSRRGGRPAAAPRPQGGDAESTLARDQADRQAAERYWRREAQRVRERMRALVDQAETLRARIAAQEEQQRRSFQHGRRAGSTAPRGDGQAALRGQLASVERRMRGLEEELADRARREGALPGWLR